jgi:hydroxymethylglutaryl-CoA reductase
MIQSDLRDVRRHCLSISQAPVFRFASPLDAVSFYRRLSQLEDELRLAAESTSRFAKLQRVVPHLFGKDVHVRFVYTCGDASGQNMSSVCLGSLV